MPPPRVLFSVKENSTCSLPLAQVVSSSISLCIWQFHHKSLLRVAGGYAPYKLLKYLFTTATFEEFFFSPLWRLLGSRSPMASFVRVCVFFFLLQTHGKLNQREGKKKRFPHFLLLPFRTKFLLRLAHANFSTLTMPLFSKETKTIKITLKMLHARHWKVRFLKRRKDLGYVAHNPSQGHLHHKM